MWAFELNTRAAEIAKRVDVAGVRFVPGPLPDRSKTESEAERETRVEVNEQDREEGARLAAEINDENLRKMVARAASASLARARDSRFL
jgi:hypothetical protein